MFFLLRLNMWAGPINAWHYFLLSIFINYFYLNIDNFIVF